MCPNGHQDAKRYKNVDVRVLAKISGDTGGYLYVDEEGKEEDEPEYNKETVAFDEHTAYDIEYENCDEYEGDIIRCEECDEECFDSEGMTQEKVELEIAKHNAEKL